MNTSSDGCYGARSGPVTITVHGGGDDMVLPLITLGSVPVSGAAFEAHTRACLAELNLLADND
ncbi:hypothetical protein BKG82_28080 [Mycobacteroides chelonae]|uniref:Uncharacterized protein n=1 Tax=Mycobacteroides chelonae TaxID=1774 RepID=A0A1S1LI23_MYCCH|nr:hypothetical protein BKG82_28080 [Mycobacteroides chelonae]